MKRIFINTIILTLLASGIVYAGECDLLDVFEEIVITDTDVTCENFSVETTKNTPVISKLKFIGNGEIAAEIVSLPLKGELNLIAASGEFTYTPSDGQTGTDSFRFRIIKDGQNSNIATCDIIIKESTSETPGTEFVYEDMRSHWANYSAVKLVNEDIIKGERIGKRYYFYPETSMRRIDVIEYILAALKIDFEQINKNETHIFEDSADLPEYINYAAYLGHKYGFVNGVRVGEKIYLYPYEYIKRAEIIKMIDSAMGEKTMSGTEIKFMDEAAIPDWAVQSVKNLTGYGIIAGYDDGLLRPYENITKAQTAEMICQMIKYNRQNTQNTMAMRIKNEFYGKITA